MSDLQLNFGEIYKQVSDFLATGTSPAGAALTKAKAITYRGYRRFLMPMNMRNGRSYVWSFLKQKGEITLETGQWEYELPTDFSHFLWGPKYAAHSNYPNPRPTSIGNIEAMRSVNSSNSYPFFWSLDTLRYSVEVGTAYSMVFHPTPNVDLSMTYGYTIVPDKPTDDAHYFIGGALASEAILECALAEAELQEDDKLDVHSKRAADMVQTLLERDIKTTMRSIGSPKSTMMIDPALARQLRWINSPTSAYGVNL